MTLNIKKINQHPINLFDALIIFLFTFFILLFFFSLVGWFNLYTIAGLALVSFLFIKIKFKVDFQFKNVDKKYLILCVLTIFVLTGFMWFRGYIDGDATAIYLPQAKVLAQTGQMPYYTFNVNHFFHSTTPLSSLNRGIIYLIFGRQDIYFTLISYFFVFLSLICLYLWGKQKGINKKYLYFLPLIFICNPIILKRGWDVLAEPTLIFWFTSFFYYFEKWLHKKDNLSAVLMFLILCLSLLTKVYSAIFLIPLTFIFFRKNFYNSKKYLLPLILLPYFLWLTWVYVLYGNPFIPALSGLFKGYFYQALLDFEGGLVGLKERLLYLLNLSPQVIKNIFYFFPVLLLSIYGFIKDKKIYYPLLLFPFLFGIIFIIPFTGYARHFSQFIGLIIIYFLLALTQIKSKILSSIYLGIMWFGLLSAQIPSSASQFIQPLENKLSFIQPLINFLNSNAWLIALSLALFSWLFYKNKSKIKYIILIQLSSFFVFTTYIDFSWLIVWLPILLTLIIFLIWPFIEKIKINLNLFTKIYLLGLFIMSTLCLTIPYALAYNEFQLPKKYYLQDNLPVAEKIISLEKDNRNFYIVSDYAMCLAWRFNFNATSSPGQSNFRLQTGYAYHEQMTSQEIYKMLLRSNIKYIIRFRPDRHHLDNFFNKIENQPQYFELIWQGEDSTAKIIRLWRLKNYE